MRSGASYGPWLTSLITPGLLPALRASIRGMAARGQGDHIFMGCLRDIGDTVDMLAQTANVEGAHPPIALLRGARGLGSCRSSGLMVHARQGRRGSMCGCRGLCDRGCV